MILQKIYRTNNFGRVVPPNKSDKSSPKSEADDAFLADAEVDAAPCDPLAVPLTWAPEPNIESYDIKY